MARLVALLDDTDPSVRRAVTSVLEEAVAHADTVVAALRSRWPAQDRGIRLNQILTVGSLTAALTAATLPETLLWLRDLTGDPDEQVRFAATLALRKALPGRRRGALHTAADLLSFSRRDGRLLPALREMSGDPDPETRIRALHLLAAPPTRRASPCTRFTAARTSGTRWGRRRCRTSSRRVRGGRRRCFP